MPEPFRHRIRVRFNECDGQGVVFYANYLMYFDVAMTELWREAFDGGYAGMIAAGTDAMVAEATIGNTSSTTELRAERVADGVVLAEGELRHVFIDPATLQKREIPDEVRLGMSRFAA